MSSKYDPLMWRGEDAQFAVNMEHLSYCGAEFSKDAARKLTDPSALSIARQSASENEKIYRKLRQMARSLSFEFPKKDMMQSCPEAEKAQMLEGGELQKAYLEWVRGNTETMVQQFDAEVDQPEKPYNYGLRKMAQKERQGLLAIQGKLSEKP